MRAHAGPRRGGAAAALPAARRAALPGAARGPSSRPPPFSSSPGGANAVALAPPLLARRVPCASLARLDARPRGLGQSYSVPKQYDTVPVACGASTRKGRPLLSRLLRRTAGRRAPEDGPWCCTVAPRRTSPASRGSRRPSTARRWRGSPYPPAARDRLFFERRRTPKPKTHRAWAQGKGVPKTLLCSCRSLAVPHAGCVCVCCAVCVVSGAADERTTQARRWWRSSPLCSFSTLAA